MRIICLDVGQKRIGVALSDPAGLIASPFGTITCVSESQDIDSVLRLAAENEAEEIVVGLPLSLSGHAGPQARQVARFTNSLSRRATVPVRSLDERYSTIQAEKLLRESGVKRTRERVDAAAAAVVLQSYLDSGGAGRESCG